MENKTSNAIGKPLLIIAIILAAFYFVCKPSKKSEEYGSTQTKIENEKNVVEDKPVDPTVQLKFRLGVLEETLERAKLRTTKSEIFAERKIFEATEEDITEVYNNKEKKVVELRDKLAKKLKQIQIEDFPILRKNLGKDLSEVMWEQNVTVTTGGGKSEIITFTGGSYANNKNIKDSYESIKEVLTLMRFKTANFKWYKGADEYTYYTIPSRKDADVYGY